MQKNIYIIIFVLLLAGAVGFHLVQTREPKPAPLVGPMQSGQTSEEVVDSGEDSIPTNSVSPASPGIETSDNTGDYSIEIEPINLPPAPDLDRALVFPESMSDEDRVNAAQKIAEISDTLTQDQNNFLEWINLGLHYKLIEDYASTREVWEYASLIRPENSLSFDNLANLYGYHLRDFDKADKNHRIAIQNDPYNISLYARAALFYRDVVKDIEKAREYIRWGIENNPQDADLQAALEELGG